MESTPPENKNALKGQESLRHSPQRVLLERWEPEGARRWLGSPFGLWHQATWAPWFSVR